MKTICTSRYLVLILFILLTACSKTTSTDQDVSIDDDDPVVTGPPVETWLATANYPPAFQGQTRIGSVITTTRYSHQVLTADLHSPWGIAELPDGRLLITEKGGQMRIVTTAGGISQAITGFPAMDTEGQAGLLDVCIDPAFGSNHLIYFTYVRKVAGGSAVAVGKARLAGNETQIESPSVIYASNHPTSGTSNYGSRILFDPYGNLLVSFGDRTYDTVRSEAQSVRSTIGKIIRITRDGAAAPGNPKFSEAGAIPGLYSMGHRNPQGMAFHPVTGELWASEHGPHGGDELNLLKPGRNYGWPIISYGIEYSGLQVGMGIRQYAGLEQPVYFWDPVVSPSGIGFYAGNRIPEWENNLFLCALSQNHLIRLVIRHGSVIGEERLLASEAQRFRDIIQGSDQALYAITDQGRLYRIDREE